MLPPARDSFVGRGEDLRSIRERLISARLVTIIGPPGIGKTRAAIELARRFGGEYDRVCFVALGGAKTLGGALAAIGAALELDLPPIPEALLPSAVGEAVARLGRSLLVLDNFEQLVDCASILVDHILERAPQTQVLVTSRARLRLSGEWVSELRGLATDEDESDAIALLIDRVRRLRGAYEPATIERGQLRAIAARVDGVPLTLEVAAIRISTLGAANVAARLDEPLPEHLRRAVARSWDLLTDVEREVLAACSLFRGGFDLSAATAVLPPAPDLAGRLHELCEKSLLSTTPKSDGTQRFHLYESIREFAAEQLDQETRGELERRHAEHYAGLGERLQRDAEGLDAREILDALSAEHANLISAADRTLAQPGGFNANLGMRALLAVAPLALARGPIEPLVDKLDRALERSRELDPRIRIAAHLAAGRGHRRLGRTEPSRRHQADAIAIAAELADDGLVAKVTSDAAMTLLGEGDCENALAMLREAAVARAQARDLSGAALDNLRMGIALRELGRIDEAEVLLGDALDVFHRDGNAFLAGLAYGELVHVALDRGDYPRAHQLLHRARKSGAQSASRLTEGALHSRAGMLAQAEGDPGAAETYLDLAIQALGRIGYQRLEAGVIGYRAIVDYEAGRLDLARARLIGSRDAVARDPRAFEMFCGWLCVVEVALGDLKAARRAAGLIGPLRPGDPLSVAAHVLTGALTKVVPELVPSHDVRIAVRATGGDVANALRVGPSGEWFVLPDGKRGECRGQRAARLILLGLVKQRLRHPEGTVSRDELIAAGWPGERIQPDAARNRLKVAIAALRRLGLGDFLQRSDRGYFLDRSLPVMIAPDGS